MCYQTLSFVECLEILRQAKAVRAAFFDGHAPYVVPMGFEWFVNGMQPVVCLMMPQEGRKAEALSVCTQVCLEFEAPDAARFRSFWRKEKPSPCTRRTAQWSMRFRWKPCRGGVIFCLMTEPGKSA